MDSKQIFIIVTIGTALSAAMIATPVMAQNMTGKVGGVEEDAQCSASPACIT
jgi:hypothetical protein